MSQQHILDRLKATCVQISTPTHIGSGFVIAPRHIITCCHVVDDLQPGEPIKCRFLSNSAHSEATAQILLCEPSIDIAVLSLNGTGAVPPPLRLGRSDAANGSWFAYAFPAFAEGAGIRIEGEISDCNAIDPNGLAAIALHSHMFHSKIELGGISGSPVVSGDKIIGVLYRVLGARGERTIPQLGLCYAIPAENFSKAITDAIGVSAHAVMPATAAAGPARESRLVHHLLSARDFQARPEYDRLVAWWREAGKQNRGGVCALVGIGGAGKTAIVERFLRVMPLQAPLFAEHPDFPVDSSLPTPQRMFVFSFYNASNPDVFVAQLAAWIRGLEYDDKIASPSFEEVRRELLAMGGCLIVLDGLEKIQDDGLRGTAFGRISDGRLRDFVLSIAEGRLPNVRLLITTRFRLFDEVRRRATHYLAISIERLSPLTAVRLLRVRGVARGSDADLEQLAAEHGCHALSVDLLGGLISRYYGGDPARLPRDLAIVAAVSQDTSLDPAGEEIREQNDRFRRLAQRYREVFQHRDPGALTVLEHVCLFRLGAPAGLIKALFASRASMDEVAIERSLKLLSLMRLIELGDDGRYSVHPAVRDGFVRDINSAAMQDGNRAARAGLEAILTARPGAGAPRDVQTLDLLEEVIHHTVELNEVQEAWDMFDQRLGGFEHLCWRLGLYERADRLYRSLADPQPPHAPRAGLTVEAQLRFDAGWAQCKMALGQVNGAYACYRRLASLRAKTGSGTTARDRDLLTEIQLLSGRLREALTSVESTLAIAKRDRDRVAHCRALALLLHVQALRGKISAAGNANVGLEHQAQLDEPVFQLRRRYAAQYHANRGDVQGSVKIIGPAQAKGEDAWGTAGTATQFFALEHADLATARGEFEEAKHKLDSIREWATVHEAKELLCCSGKSLVRLHLVRCRATQESMSKPLVTSLLHDVSNEIERAWSCGYGIHCIDLLILRAQLHLHRGDAAAVLADVCSALYDGIPAADGKPAILAACHGECGYGLAQSAASAVLAEGLLLEAACKLGRMSYAVDKALPGHISKLIQAARVRLARGGEEVDRIRDVDAGVLTRYANRLPPGAEDAAARTRADHFIASIRQM
jgi:hypothetical protein